MGPIRRFLARAMGMRAGGTAITVGSYISSTDEQNVSINLLDGWNRANAALTPDGARRVARQLIEWADAADKRNEETAHTRTVMQWAFVTKDAIEAAKGKIKEEAPAAS